MLAILYKVKYNENKTLKNAEAVKVDINGDKYTTDVDVEDGDCLFLWDENMQPLAENITVEPSPTATPIPTVAPTSAPTAKPTCNSDSSSDKDTNIRSSLLRTELW